MFGKPNGKDLAAPKSGGQWALEAIGLGAAVDAAKQLLDAGAIERILQFADQVGAINERLAKIECAIASLAAALARNGTDGQPAASGVASGTVDHDVRRSVDATAPDRGHP
jgi:hypothetical protein